MPETPTAPYFPMARAAGCPFDPPGELRAAVAEHPVSRVRIWDGSTPWIVTGHAEQRALFSDPRVSVDDRLPGFPHWNEGIAKMAPHRSDSVFNTDPPVHTGWHGAWSGNGQKGSRVVIGGSTPPPRPRAVPAGP